MENNLTLPTYLRSIEDLSQHFEEHFESLGSAERGDSFLEFAKRVIPFTDVGRNFRVRFANRVFNLFR